MNVPSARVRPTWRGPAVFAAVLATVALVAFLLLRGGAEEEVEPEPVVAVETAVVGAGTMDVTIDAIGTVEPRPGYAAEISAPEASRVERILVSVGDRVRPGQSLVELDRSVWAARRAQAQTTLENAQRAYDRAQRLLEQGILPRKDVDEAESNLGAARAAFQEAQRTEQLGILRSPIEGVVVELNATLSQPVDPAQPVVEVVNPQGLEVLFHLPAADAARVQSGAAVELSSGEGSQRVAIGGGIVRGVSAALDSTGSVAVRAVFAEPPQLRAGQLLNGRIVAARLENVLLVPLSALVPEEDGFVVYVVDAGGVAHATPVDVAERTSTEAHVTSGLHDGDVVVTEGAYGVTDGAHVERSGDVAPREVPPPAGEPAGGPPPP
jgi:RND family efflux transporter MFP subunit